MKKKTTMERNSVETAANHTSDGDPMQKIEEALQFCKFGRFQVRLILASMTSVIAASVTTCTSSYIAPSAECDLALSNVQKGFLLAVPFFGQLTSAPIGGFFSDAFGRKAFLIYGNMLMSFCCLFQGFSNTYWMIIVFKLAEGIFSGLTSIQMAPMLAEMSSKDIRDRVLLFYALFYSIGQSIVLACAWAVLPTGINVIIWDGYFELRAWQIFIFVCSIWGLLAALQYSVIPESPKVLLSCGKNEEAFEVLRNIYSENTRNKKDQFPMTTLLLCPPVSPNNRKNIINKIKCRLFNAKELFRKPMVHILLLLSFSTFVGRVTTTTLRLWYPQLSTLVEDYKKLHEGEPSKFCTMLDSYYYQNKSQVLNILTNHTEICVPKISGFETYLNTLSMALSGGVFMGVCVSLVNRVGMKKMVIIALLLGGACSLTLHWANTSALITTAIIVVYCFNSASCHMINSIVVRAFPTTVRSFAISLAMACSRFGGLLGNVVFPIVVEYGCVVPFGFLSVALFVLGLMCIFLPNPSKENKETGDR